ncbi:MAG: hypothetical protein AB7U59_10495 [Desulfovibrionaceae bacterium]
MKQLTLAFCLVILLAATAWAMDPRQGFGKYRWGQPCQSFVTGPAWAVERARPIWDPQVRAFGLEYEAGDTSKSRFVLHYNKDENPNFEGVPLGRAFYGCDRTTGKLSLMVLSHDLLAVPELIRKTTAFLGPPTQTTMVQTIWTMPELYVQIDQVYMILYDRRAGKIE